MKCAVYQAICPKQWVGCCFSDIGCEEKLERDSMEAHEANIWLHFKKLHVYLYMSYKSMSITCSQCSCCSGKFSCGISFTSECSMINNENLFYWSVEVWFVINWSFAGAIRKWHGRSQHNDWVIANCHRMIYLFVILSQRGLNVEFVFVNILIVHIERYVFIELDSWQTDLENDMVKANTMIASLQTDIVWFVCFHKIPALNMIINAITIC